VKRNVSKWVECGRSLETVPTWPLMAGSSTPEGKVLTTENARLATVCELTTVTDRVHRVYRVILSANRPANRLHGRAVTSRDRMWWSKVVECSLKSRGLFIVGNFRIWQHCVILSSANFKVVFTVLSCTFVFLFLFIILLKITQASIICLIYC